MVPKQNFVTPRKENYLSQLLREMTDEEMNEWIEGYRNKVTD